MSNVRIVQMSELAWLPVKHIVAIHQLFEHDGGHLTTHGFRAAVGVEEIYMVRMAATKGSHSQLLLHLALLNFLFGHVGVVTDECYFADFLLS